MTCPPSVTDPFQPEHSLAVFLRQAGYCVHRTSMSVRRLSLVANRCSTLIIVDHRGLEAGAALVRGLAAKGAPEVIVLAAMAAFDGRQDGPFDVWLMAWPSVNDEVYGLLAGPREEEVTGVPSRAPVRAGVGHCPANREVPTLLPPSILDSLMSAEEDFEEAELLAFIRRHGPPARTTSGPAVSVCVAHTHRRQFADAVKAIRSSVLAGVQPKEQEIAAAVRLHRSRLSRLIASVAGVGFREVRRITVARMALRHLMSSDEQVAQVAYSLGFEHPNQFAREFRQVFGVSPSECRRLASPGRHPHL